jgi:hypothetical protein
MEDRERLGRDRGRDEKRRRGEDRRESAVQEVTSGVLRERQRYQAAWLR